MRAVVRTKPGARSVLQLDESYPTPTPKPGHVLIRIKAIGCNRAELRSRAGEPPAKTEFQSDDLYTTEPPKVLGEECVGVIADAGGSSSLRVDDVVAAYFCGIGKVFDGSYAEYTLVPEKFVYKLDTELSWEILGAIPSTFMTAYGSLHHALHIREGDTLLVHGGTSSVGAAAIMLAKLAGCKVAATTRQARKTGTLRSYGADVILIDTGDVETAQQLKSNSAFKDGADHVLELIGPDKLNVAFSCTKRYGTVCVTGVLTGCWSLENWAPAEGIETGKSITTFQCSRDAVCQDHGAPLQEIVKHAEKGALDVKAIVGKVLKGLESIGEAHELMEANKVSGKVVVVLE